MPKRKGEHDEHLLLKMVRGDGKQTYLSPGPHLEIVEEDWFPGRIGDHDALLARFADGPRAGELVALTSRFSATIPQQIESMTHIGVVVHALANPGPSFSSAWQDNDPVGMAVLEIVTR